MATMYIVEVMSKHNTELFVLQWQICFRHLPNTANGTVSWELPNCRARIIFISLKGLTQNHKF